MAKNLKTKKQFKKTLAQKRTKYKKTTITLLVATFLVGTLLAVGYFKPNTVSNEQLDTTTRRPRQEKVDASALIKNPQVINDKGDILVTESKDFKILYFPKTNQFLVSILSSPFEKARLSAEEEFLKTLSIDKKLACELNVLITTPVFINPNEAGKEYRLSFCDKN